MALLHKYLTWSRPELVTPDDENDEEGEAGPLEKIRASICEIAELYTQRYLEVFSMMEQFVETTWTLVTGLGSSTKYDIVSLYLTVDEANGSRMRLNRRLCDALAGQQGHELLVSISAYAGQEAYVRRPRYS